MEDTDKRIFNALTLENFRKRACLAKVKIKSITPLETQKFKIRKKARQSDLFTNSLSISTILSERNFSAFTRK